MFMLVLMIRVVSTVTDVSMAFFRNILVLRFCDLGILLRSGRGGRTVFRISLFTPYVPPFQCCKDSGCCQPLSLDPAILRNLLLTLISAAIVIVRPHPIELATGSTNAEAPAAKRYRMTTVSLHTKASRLTVIHSDQFCTSALHAIDQAGCQPTDTV